MTQKIRLRRGTAAQWTAVNPVLGTGEPGLETDTFSLKFGDGSTPWTGLPYSLVADLSGLETALASEESTRAAADVALDVRVDALEAGVVPAITVPVWDAEHDPVNIYHGAFWPTGVDLGPCMWRCWLRFDNGAEYWVTEGFGGAHAILAGLGGSGGPAGNMFDGSGNVAFSGYYQAQDGEWLLYDVVYDESAIWVLINGIVCGRTPFDGPRLAQYGDLMIGGSDHSNMKGAIAQVQAWEGQLPAELGPGPWYGANYPAERYFSDRMSTAGRLAQFSTSYLAPVDQFPDVSDGYAGSLHPGASRGVYNGFGHDVGPDTHPLRAVDPTAPFGNQIHVPRTRVPVGPVSAPVGAKRWDSFGRADTNPCWTPVDYATAINTTLDDTTITAPVPSFAERFVGMLVDAPGVPLGARIASVTSSQEAELSVPATATSTAAGTTLRGVHLGVSEGGSLGPKLWSHAANAWCVFDNAAVCLSFYTFARLEADSADMDVRVEHKLDRARGFTYGSVAVRIKADLSSGWNAFTSVNYLGVRQVLFRRPDDSVIGTYTPTNQDFDHMRLTTSGTTITLYVDDGGAGWEQLHQATGETANQAEVGGGMYHYYGTGTLARYTDFEVR